MDTGYTDRVVTRFAALRRSLDKTREQARRAAEATRLIQDSETMQQIIAQQRLNRTRAVLKESSTLID